MLSYDAERKRLRKLGQVLENSIVVARLLFEISNYSLPILILLEILHTPEDYVALSLLEAWKVKVRMTLSI